MVKFRKFKAKTLKNWAIVLLMALFFGGVLGFGIFEEQLGEVLFNATLV